MAKNGDLGSGANQARGPVPDEAQGNGGVQNRRLSGELNNVHRRSSVTGRVVLFGLPILPLLGTIFWFFASMRAGIDANRKGLESIRAEIAEEIERAREVLGESVVLQESNRQLLVLDFEDRIVEAVRQVSFAGQRNRTDPYIAAAVKRASELEAVGLQASDERFGVLLTLAKALAYTRDDPGDASEQLRSLRDLIINHPHDARVGMMAHVLMGMIISIQNEKTHSPEAYRHFEEAKALEQRNAQFRIGLAYNGAAGQMYWKAIRQSNTSEVIESLREVKRNFREADDIDQTRTSRYRSLNNVLNVDLRFVAYHHDGAIDLDMLLQSCAERLVYHPAARSEGAKLTVLFEGMLVDLQQAIALSGGRGHVFGTASQYWSMRGEYEERQGNAHAASDCFESSEHYLRSALSAGMFQGKNGEVAFAEIDERLRRGMLDDEDEDGTKRRERIRQYFVEVLGDGS
jgi:hypothetical protein